MDPNYIGAGTTLLTPKGYDSPTETVGLLNQINNRLESLAMRIQDTNNDLRMVTERTFGLGPSPAPTPGNAATVARQPSMAESVLNWIDGLNQRLDETTTLASGLNQRL